MSELAFKSAAAIAEMIRTKAASPVEVAQSVLSSVERIDPILHAFLATDSERVMETARACEQTLMAGGRLPPLLGVPIAIKDMEATVDFPTSQGSRVYRSSRENVDAAHVARLRAAGAVIVGKTNTPEFALLGETRNRLGPECRNPWDPTRTPGGSSGGSASAVAAGLIPLATGTDTAGSITIPSGFSGTVGLKPTHRRIPIWPNTHEWPSLYDTGPITRSVRDCALALSIMAGPDPRDPWSVKTDAVGFGCLGDPPPQNMRIALAETLGDVPIDPDNQRAADDVAGACGELGHSVLKVDPPCGAPAPTLDRIGCVQEYRYRGHLLSAHRDELEPSTVAVMEAGRDLRAIDYAQALEQQDAARDQLDALFMDHDVLIMPAAACAAFPVGDPPRSINGVPVEPDWSTFAPLNMLANLTGHPALCIPGARDTDTLPLGVLLVGHRGREDRLLGLAAEIERIRPWGHRIPEIRA